MLLAQSARSRKPVVEWVRTWKTGDVQGWLRASGLAHQAPAFANISGKVCDLTCCVIVIQALVVTSPPDLCRYRS